MFIFEDTTRQVPKSDKDKTVPPSAEIAEESSKITARELDDYIQKGNIWGHEDKERDKNKEDKK